MNNTQKNLPKYLALLSLVFFGLAFTFEYLVIRHQSLDKYASIIEQGLHESERQIETYLLDKSLHHELLSSYYDSNFSNYNVASEIDKLSKEKLGFYIQSKGKIAYWSNNIIPTIQLTPKQLSKSTIKLRNGYFKVYTRKLKDKKYGFYTIVGFLPIKNEYSLESKYLVNNFNFNSEIPSNISISFNPKDIPVRGKGGDVEFYIKYLNKKSITSINYLYTLLSFHIIAFILLLLLLDTIALQIGRKQGLLRAMAFLVGTFFLIIIIGRYSGFFNKYDQIFLFKPSFEKIKISNSVGELILVILLLFWITIFYFKYNNFKTDHLKFKQKKILGITLAIGVVISIISTIYIFKGVILASTFYLDFQNVIFLIKNSFLSSIIIILIQVFQFFLSYMLMKHLLDLKISLKNRYSYYLFGTLLTIGIGTFFDTKFNLLATSGIILIYLFLFDLYVSKGKTSFLWIAFWFIGNTFLTSYVIVKYYETKFEQQIIKTAEILANPQDTLAENAIENLIHKVKNDKLIQAIGTKETQIISPKEIKDIISTYYSENSYLFKNYDYNVFFFNKNDSLENNKYSEIITRSKNADQTIIPNLKLVSNYEKKDFSYIYKLENDSTKNKKNTVIFINFFKAPKAPSKVYTKLMSSFHYKGIKINEGCSISIYKNRDCFYSTDNFFPDKMVNIKNQELPDIGQHFVIKEKNSFQILYRYKEDLYIKINQVFPTGKNIWTLFSGLFTLVNLFFLVLVIINTFIPGFLPEDFSLGFSKIKFLKDQIIRTLTFVIIIFLILTSVITYRSFFTSNEIYNSNRLGRKTLSVLNDTHHELAILNNTSEIASSNSNIIDKLDIDAISKIHRLDINLFDLNGKLLNSSEKDIFRKGILNRRMSSAALFSFKHKKSEEYIQKDVAMGDLTYQVSYVPLKRTGIHGEETIGYLGLPYYAGIDRVNKEVADFMGKLWNYYIILFIIALAFIVYTAGKIIRPIKVLAAKLKEFRLGGKNKTINWPISDELGLLINEYNQMASKVEESAKLMKKSERQDAWQTMASQIAHDIKTPLTPMKLNLEYLLYAINSNYDNIEDMVKRTAETMVEQINNLADTAETFRNFASTNKVENIKLNINQVVKSVYELFVIRKEVNIVLEEPDFQYAIFGNKSQLIRTFNNLVNNAIQAIPKGHPGEINIKLYEKENRIIIQIQDNGKGIPEEMMDKIFIPNFTTKNSGSGLGLAISQTFIEAIDGEIYFESELNIGTSFYVSLPIIDRFIL